MSDFDFKILQQRIDEMKSYSVELDDLVILSYKALSLLESKYLKPDFVSPSKYIELHGQDNFVTLKRESENLAAYYRSLYLCGFLYSLLSYATKSPIDLGSLDKVRLSFTTFNELNRDEKVIYLIRYRFKDFNQTARWMGEDKEFTETITELRKAIEVILSRVNEYLAKNS